MIIDYSSAARSGFASLLLAFLLSGTSLPAQGLSALVHPGSDGKLVYAGYANQGQTRADNRMIDFSRAGYRGGGVAIPWVPVEITLSPLAGTGDDRARIQAAIDLLGARPLSSAGFRGTILLRAGTYRVSQSLRVAADGIVIRGEGQHGGGTVIRFTSTVQSDLFEFSGSAGWSRINGTERPIADSLVPSGARSFNVTSTNGLAVGDRLMVHRTPNQAWISLLGMDKLATASQPDVVNWTPEGYRSQTPRVITALNGNTITVDAPLVHAIESRYGGGEVYRYHFNGALRNVGIERIRLESAFTSDTDEDHGWSAVKFQRVENGWARQVTARYFGYSCIDIRANCQFITVEDCAQLDPKSIITGSRRYSFNLNDSSFVLMQRCYTRDGRHDYVTGARTRGPNVFVDCLAENTRSDIGPHHRYAEGLLFDNVRGGSTNVQNRRTSGTGHGWAGAQTVFWNCRATNMVCDAPAAAMNFSIGTIGTQQQGSWPPAEADGIWESRGVPVTPRSLYHAQLADRLGHRAVATVTTSQQRAGPIWTSLSAWRGDSEAPGLPAFTPLQVDVGADVPGGSESHHLDAIIRHPLPANFPLTQGWTQLGGPAEAVFEDASSPSTTVTFPAAGVYELRFAASQEDNRDPENIISYRGSDTVSVTVIGRPIATVDRSSVDMIVGRRQDNAAALGYYPDSTNETIGVSGSNETLTRADRNLVLGYTLPELPTGSTITGATLNFEIKGYQNHSGADPGLDLYLLDTAAPEDSGTAFFFHGTHDPNPGVIRVGGINLGEPQGNQVNYPAGTHVKFLALGGEALAFLKSRYGNDGKPEKDQVFFRFNLDHLILSGGNGNLGGNAFNRYFIDIAPSASGLQLFGTPGGGGRDSFADWIAGFNLAATAQGPDDDPDGDGIPNALENFFGTHPGEFSQGPGAILARDGSFTFSHPRNPQPAANLIAAYRWSTDLADFHGDGETDAAGTTVAFSSSTAAGVTTVNAEVSGNVVDRLFVTIEASVD